MNIRMSLAKKTAATLAFLTMVAAPLSADLKYTTHLEIRPSMAGGAANPMFAMAGDMMIKMIAPGGSIDTTCTVSEKGMRCEQNKETAMLPAGAVQLIKPDGMVVIFNPKDKTFWKMPTGGTPEAAAMLAQMKPTVTTKKTTDTATIAGARAEKSTFEVSMPLPLPPGVELPPGMPTALTMSGELWSAPQYKDWAAKSTAANAMMKQFGLEAFAKDGFTMKMILRGDVFGGNEMETTVTKIGEESVPADHYDVPAGFKEIPAPPIKIGGLGGRR